MAVEDVKKDVESINVASAADMKEQVLASEESM